MAREIIVDNFAGGGGASTGIELATGRSVDIAINHDPAAIKMHQVNHPSTEHYCESVWDVNPVAAVNGRPVGLVWLSPDCKHFSKAKGGKPVQKEIRGLAWIGVRWAATVKPRVIMLENVEEFVTWGPLTKDGQPDPKQKGRTFKSFVNALKRLGYKVDWRELRACDYGAPTIRKRLFLIARRDGRPIVWPEPTHGHPESEAVKSGKLKPWRVAAEIIDWSLKCPSIFDRKKPLAENTMRRIARGIFKFVINNPRPFIVKVNHGSQDFRGQEIDEPLQTITAKNGWGIVEPFIARIGQTGFGGDRLQYELGKPLTTITTKAEHLLVVPHVTKFRGGATGHAVDEPLHTITSGAGSARPAGAAHALGIVNAVLRPLPKPQEVMIAPFIAREFGQSVGHSVESPSGTITSGGGGKSRLIEAFLVKNYGGNYTGAGSGMEEPVSTVTTKDHNSLAAVFLTKYHGETPGSEARGQKLDGPLLTLDTSNRFSLVTSHMIKMRGTNIGHRTDEPLHTVTSGGLHLGEVRAFLIKYYGTEIGQSCDTPLHTVVSKDKFGLVTIQGENGTEEWQIVDIGMRMLEPHELFAAQGFPPDYIIDRDFEGNSYPKSAQVARCGNSVPPPFAEHLVRANLPELCVVPLEGDYTSATNLKIGQMSMFDEVAAAR